MIWAAHDTIWRSEALHDRDEPYEIQVERFVAPAIAGGYLTPGEAYGIYLVPESDRLEVVEEFSGPGARERARREVEARGGNGGAAWTE